MSPYLKPQFRILRARQLQYSRVSRRAFHDAKAKFISFDTKGSLITQILDIFIGEPHQTYIIFRKEIGLAMESAITKQTGARPTSDPEKIPLMFYHDTLHFAHSTILVPFR